MKLSNLLSKMKELAKNNNISEPYIVGGLPRDMLLGVPRKVKDIDITTGDSGSLNLAMAALREFPDANFQIFDDQHSSLGFSNVIVDFSNNWTVPEIEEELKKRGIENPTELQKEMFSRDFTINTFLQPLDLNKEPIDITGMAYEDLKNKIIRTPIDADLIIGHDPRRILRALKLAVKYNFTLDPELEKAIFKHKEKIKDIPENQVKKIVNQMLDINVDKTLNLLTKYELLPVLSLSKALIREIAKNHLTQYILEA